MTGPHSCLRPPMKAAGSISIDQAPCLSQVTQPLSVCHCSQWHTIGTAFVSPCMQHELRRMQAILTHAAESCDRLVPDDAGVLHAGSIQDVVTAAYHATAWLKKECAAVGKHASCRRCSRRCSRRMRCCEMAGAPALKLLWLAQGPNTTAC